MDEVRIMKFMTSILPSIMQQYPGCMDQLGRPQFWTLSLEKMFGPIKFGVHGVSKILVKSKIKIDFNQACVVLVSSNR
jgi:hypothetical protein